jgi:hypothetical protein
LIHDGLRLYQLVVILVVVILGVKFEYWN